MIKLSIINPGFLSRIIPITLILFASAVLCASCDRTSCHQPGSHINGNDPAAAPSGRRDGLSLNLSFIRGETSKDSHEYVYICRISGGHAVYSGPYGQCERGQCEHRKIEFDLTADQEAALIKAAESWGLFKDFKEIRPVNDIGTWARVSLSLAAESRSGEIRIEGMVNNWSRRGVSSAGISSPAKEKLETLDRLRRAITEIAKSHFPEYH